MPAVYVNGVRVCLVLPGEQWSSHWLPGSRGQLRDLGMPRATPRRSSFRATSEALSSRSRLIGPPSKNPLHAKRSRSLQGSRRVFGVTPVTPKPHPWHRVHPARSTTSRLTTTAPRTGRAATYVVVVRWSMWGDTTQACVVLCFVRQTYRTWTGWAGRRASHSSRAARRQSVAVHFLCPRGSCEKGCTCQPFCGHCGKAPCCAHSAQEDSSQGSCLHRVFHEVDPSCECT